MSKPARNLSLTQVKFLFKYFSVAGGKVVHVSELDVLYALIVDEQLV